MLLRCTRVASPALAVGRSHGRATAQGRARAGGTTIASRTTAFLAAALLAGCTTAGQLRGGLAGLGSSTPPADPTSIDFDLYADARNAAYRAFALGPIESPRAAAELALGDVVLLQHLQKIDGRYAGRRMPRLSWSAKVERVPPPVPGKPNPKEYWSVKLVSSDVRGSQLFYGCDLRVGMRGENLNRGRLPIELCRWQRSTSSSS
jgi:hypothetical protein